MTVPRATGGTTHDRDATPPRARVPLTSYGEAIRAVRRWVKRYPLNVADAYRMVYDHFTAGSSRR